MNEKINKLLQSVTSETFEGLAFMFGFPEEDAFRAPGEKMIATRVVFEGPFSGRLVVAVTQQTVRELTVNMLGLEEDEAEISFEDEADALKEAVNVICGNLLPRIGGKDVVFDIHSPQVLSEFEPPEKIGDKGWVTMTGLSLEDEPCGLYLYIDNENPEACLRLED